MQLVLLVGIGMPGIAYCGYGGDKNNKPRIMLVLDVFFRSTTQIRGEWKPKGGVESTWNVDKPHLGNFNLSYFKRKNLVQFFYERYHSSKFYYR